jgi:Protein of unknown function (DUF664)
VYRDKDRFSRYTRPKRDRDRQEHNTFIGQRGSPVVWLGVTTPQHRADLFLDPGSDPREGGPRLGDEPVSLRELLVHMIEEYARHNGHADLLRERIDGRVGQ